MLGEAGQGGTEVEAAGCRGQWPPGKHNSLEQLAADVLHDAGAQGALQAGAEAGTSDSCQLSFMLPSNTH